MFRIDLKHSLAAVAVAAGLLAFSPQALGSDGFWLGSNDALAAHVTDGTSNTFGA